MVNGAHRRPSRWRRKILGIPVFGWLIGLTGTALAAVIGYLVLMGVSGTFEPSAEILVYYEAAGPISAEPRVGSPTCTATFVSEDEVQFGENPKADRFEKFDGSRVALLGADDRCQRLSRPGETGHCDMFGDVGERLADGEQLFVGQCAHGCDEPFRRGLVVVSHDVHSFRRSMQ